MERKAAITTLLVAMMLQACYCGSPAWRVITSYSDSACTVPTGGVTIVKDNSCNPFSCSNSGGMYAETTCTPSDPLANGAPFGNAVRYSYSTTTGICTDPYSVARYAPPGACFIDENGYVRSFDDCSEGKLPYLLWTGDYSACLAKTDPPISDLLTIDQCRQTDVTDDKGVCPVAPPVDPPVNPPVNPPVDPPMDAPVAAPMAAPTAPVAPVAAPVSAPVKTPVTKASGAVTNTVATIIVGAIVLLL